MTEITMTAEQREKAIAVGILHLDFYAPDGCYRNPDAMNDDELFDAMAINRFAWDGGNWYQVAQS